MHLSRLFDTTKALRALTVLAALLCMAATALAADKKTEAPLQLTANDMLNAELSSPLVPAKQKAAVRAAMNAIAEKLYRSHYDVETLRDGEIIIAVIPTDKLFPPNETSLMASAGALLDTFRPYLLDRARYKVVIAVHSDDTGSMEYLLDLTEARVNAVLDYFEDRKVNVDEIVGFPMGDTDPLVENDTRANRAQNRRLEFYILPNTALIESAKNSR